MRILSRIFNMFFTVVFTGAIMVGFILFMALIQLNALRFWGAAI